MGNRTTLDFSFVALVLSVNGRVRPEDLQSIPEVQRAQLLHAFYDAHRAQEPLYFDGDALVRGTDPAGPGAAAPFPAQPAEAPAYTAAPAAATAAGLESPPDLTGLPDPAAPTATPALAPAPAPAPDHSSFFSGTPQPDPVAALGDVLATEPEPPKASFLMWLLPILLTFVGGVIAYFAVRSKNPRQARSMLITGLVLTVVYALLAAAVVAFAIFGLGHAAFSIGNEIAVPAAVYETPAEASDYPRWTVVKDRGTVLTQLKRSKNPVAKVRQDHAYEVRSPNKSVRLMAWYGRTGASEAAIRSVVWSNPDTLFKGTNGSSAKQTALSATFGADHPKETLLGAYRIGMLADGAEAYNVGWARIKVGAVTHGEHVYGYSALTGWKQSAATTTSTSVWNTTGEIR